MPRITDYTLLLQQTFGTPNTMSRIPLSNLSSSSAQAQLRAAGINTNSNQYKAVISSMSGGASGGYTNIQAIKNRMRRYDKDGDHISISNGLAGLVVTDSNRAHMHDIISIPESSREEMFKLTKKEFLRENGVHNGDTTKRSDVYTNLYRKMQKNDRLAAGHTLQQYESQYWQAFVSAVKESDPGWEIGKAIQAEALDGITRESVEKGLTQSGSTLVKNTVDVKV